MCVGRRGKQSAQGSDLARPVKLKIAIADYPNTLAVKSGAIPIEGVEPEFVNVVPQIGAFRRMVRQVEFDVCELAPTTYIIARAFNAPFVALPIFVMRRFHHSGFLVRPDAGIKVPKDLEGKKVGVRAYSVTTGVWTRGIFIDDYGLDASKVTWVVDDEEHVTQMKLPPNVVHAPDGKSLVSMMEAGEIVAGFDGNAGIGRSGSPTGGWQAAAPGANASYPELIENVEEVEAAWHRRTGIYPMHGTIVVKDSVLAENPWIAKSLFDAFSRAKNEWLVRLKSGEANTAGDKKYLALTKVVGDDPLPFGMEANMPTIRALEDTAFKQKLIPERVPLARAWVDPLKF